MTAINLKVAFHLMIAFNLMTALNSYFARHELNLPYRRRPLCAKRANTSVGMKTVGDGMKRVGDGMKTVGDGIRKT